MFFRIVKVNFIQDKDIISITCETLNSQILIIEVSNLEIEIGFEIKDDTLKTQLITEINAKFDSFRVTSREWKEIAVFNREKSTIEHLNLYVLTWNGRHSLFDYNRAINLIIPGLKKRSQEIMVYGHDMDPVEVLLKKFYNIIGSYFFINDVNLDYKKPLQWTVDHFFIAVKNYTTTNCNWCLITISSHHSTKGYINIDCCDGRSVQINTQEAIKDKTLGRRIYVEVNLPKKHSIIFVDTPAKIYSMLAGDTYQHVLYGSAVIVDKRHMPFYMNQNNFNKQDIAEKIMPYSSRLARVTHLPIFSVLSCSTGAKLVDKYLALHMSAQHNIWVSPYIQTDAITYRKPLGGGFITRPPREMIKGARIVDCDFKSYYPSIILEYGLDFESTKNIYNILPAVVKHFMNLRNQVSEEEGIVFKFIVNNLYGTLGFSQSRFYCHSIASKITEIGRRELSQHVIPLVSQMPVFKMIFANTDGLFLKYEDTACDEARYIDDVEEFCKRVNSKYDSMTIQPAAYFTDILIYATNNYVCRYTDGTFKMKGIFPIHKTSPIILKVLTEIFVKIILDDIKYPVGTKINTIFHHVKLYIAEHRNDINLWMSAYTVDKLYTYKQNLTCPLARLAADKFALPGDTIRWVYTNRAITPEMDNRAFYKKIVAIDTNDFNPAANEININAYIPLVIRCLKYLCEIYTAEPNCEVTEISFINDFHPSSYLFIEKRIREQSTKIFTFSHKIICNHCRKVHNFRGFSILLDYLLRQSTHDWHLSPDKHFTETCQHCYAQIKLFDAIAPMFLNYMNVREVYYYTSIFNLMTIARKKCKICYLAVKNFKNQHLQEFNAYEQYISGILSQSPPPSSSLSSSSFKIIPICEDFYAQPKRMRIQ